MLHSGLGAMPSFPEKYSSVVTPVTCAELCPVSSKTCAAISAQLEAGH